MVIRSIDDYQQHKADIRKHYLRIGVKPDSVDNFLNYFSNSYDKFKRGFIPFSLSWLLFDKYNFVRKRNQHYWIGFIGKSGGEGKSTLAKHCLYFLDNTFNQKRISLNYDDFIEVIKDTIKITKYPAILLDEPENKTHQLSQRGRELRDILGKIRQLNLFIGICANSLSDIPNFIFQRLQTIIYLRDNHRFWLWDNGKDYPKSTIVNEIKGSFKSHGHAVFNRREILKRAYLKHQQFSPDIPYFDEAQYLRNKKLDLMKDISNYLKPDNIGLKQKRDIRIYESWMSGKVTQLQIAEHEGLSRMQVIRICKEMALKM